MATATRFTIEDLERLPDELAHHHELVDGELIDVSGNTPRHNLLRDRLLAALLAWAKTAGEGTVLAEQAYDFQGNAHGPDVSWFSGAKRGLLDLDKRVQRFVPDLAIEVASESATYNAMLRKTDRYRRSGTPEVWIVSLPTHEITVYSGAGIRIAGTGDVISSPLLPGLTIAVGEVFEGL